MTTPKGRRPDTGTTRGRVLRVRLTDAELADLERVREERGDATLSDTVRAIGEMHDETMRRPSASTLVAHDAADRLRRAGK